MEIKKDTQTINNMNCFEYRLSVCPNEIETEKYSRYSELKATDKEIEKHLDILRNKINDDEKIIIEHGGFKNDYTGKIDFEIYTKRKEVLKRENEIKKILKKNGFNIHEYDEIDIDTDEKYLRLDIHMNYTRDEMEKIHKLLNTKDYEVILDGHMENMFIVYTL